MLSPQSIQTEFGDDERREIIAKIAPTFEQLIQSERLKNRDGSQRKGISLDEFELKMKVFNSRGNTFSLRHVSSGNYLFVVIRPDKAFAVIPQTTKRGMEGYFDQ